MLFYTFEVIKGCGSSDFIELAFCRLPAVASLDAVVAAFAFRQDDSLYVKGDDMTAFRRDYGDILGSGVYQNLQSGPVDCWGLNYYAPELIPGMAARLAAARPEGWQILAAWLQQARLYRGFYVLGV